MYGAPETEGSEVGKKARFSRGVNVPLEINFPPVNVPRVDILTFATPPAELSMSKIVSDPAVVVVKLQPG